MTPSRTLPRLEPGGPGETKPWANWLVVGVEAVGSGASYFLSQMPPLPPLSGAWT